jgi:midasin (ATPase involved in ribosome maturation)
MRSSYFLLLIDLFFETKKTKVTSHHTKTYLFLVLCKVVTFSSRLYLIFRCTKSYWNIYQQSDLKDEDEVEKELGESEWNEDTEDYVL